MEKRKDIATSKDEKICFLISPIGGEGTDTHIKFKDVYDYIVKPAIDNSGYKLNVIRADDINRAGSFIKDILENIVNSFVVIADMTNRNPNVFYELGVRHSLAPRTILISQTLEDIPSDLREYRTILYDTSAKGSKLFAEKIKKYLSEIFEEPDRSDNPVLDRVGNIIESRTYNLEKEINRLKNELSNILKKSAKKVTSGIEVVDIRFKRITKLMRSERQSTFYDITTVEFYADNSEYEIVLPTNQGSFVLYYVMDGETIDDYWYVSVTENLVSIDSYLADVRVLISHLSEIKKPRIPVKFIIVTNQSLENEKKEILKKFDQIKTFISQKKRSLYQLLLWDEKGLYDEEVKLGLKVK